MYYLENENYKVSVSEEGAEIASFYDKKKRREYVWPGKEIWHRHAPVLFPAIGGFVDKTYYVNGEKYELPPHGFARDKEFTLAWQKDDAICFELHEDEETKKMYPYAFRLQIEYRLDDGKLAIVWRVKNTSDEKMYYNIGAHPAFPLVSGTELSDYEIELDKEIPFRTYRVIGRLVTKEKETVGEATDHFGLTPELLKKDALVFEEGLSSIAMKCEKEDYRLKVSFPGFPVVAIWTPPADAEHAKFVCIEPWVGLNDFVEDQTQELKEKYLVKNLDQGEEAEYSYTIEVDA